MQKRHWSVVAPLTVTVIGQAAAFNKFWLIPRTALPNEHSIPVSAASPRHATNPVHSIFLAPPFPIHIFPSGTEPKTGVMGTTALSRRQWRHKCTDL
jgi:hypothetical protein